MATLWIILIGIGILFIFFFGPYIGDFINKTGIGKEVI